MHNKGFESYLNQVFNDTRSILIEFNHFFLFCVCSAREFWLADFYRKKVSNVKLFFKTMINKKLPVPDSSIKGPKVMILNNIMYERHYKNTFSKFGDF